MSKNVDFTVDYKKLNIMDEFNTDNLKYPLLLSIPHSGTVFPEEFLKIAVPEIKADRKSVV